MQGLLQDLRFAIRQLRKTPGFSLTTVLTLALGIGATTAIFSLINAVLLRPLPFPDPDRLMTATSLDTSAGNPGVPSSLSYPDFFDWRSRNHSFEGMASYHPAGRTLTGNGTAQQLEGQVVSSGFFRVLGVKPILGREFVSEDEKGGSRAVVLSHETWQSLFGGSSDIVGRTITLDNNTYAVLVLSAVGLYAVLSYMVAQRTLEIGLRLALGAQRDNVLGPILRRGMLLALVGLAIGLVASLLLTRFMQEMLYGVHRFDPVTFMSVSAVLLLVSLLASSVPALRAAHLDPMQTLREQ